MSGKTFAEYERDGWERNAGDYDEIDLPATGQAIDSLLESLGDLKGQRLLEIASGTGHLAKAAVARGATVVGIDVATNMVELARKLVPGATFEEGNGEALPFEDETFSAVACSFGLLHMAQPETAVREVARVLRPGGTFAFTVWYGPDNGSEFFRVLLRTYQELADMNVDLPPAPPLFALSDSTVYEPMLRRSGFQDINGHSLAIVWPLRGPETVFEFATKGAVRTRMLYERQSHDVQQRIRDALVEKTIPYLRDGKNGIPCPVALVTARKPW
jgi:SAM-dependent methyltransferase